ncbi:hypothetical protein [Corynebacterium kalidii]|uniref:Uncharacterized protein n=1 Tax=Corynebacterium kalidii TaxID=2931982 RepID=A0A9X2B2M3_9CORY|nr:hypothetical protein [Corynebacterium kalidii]MCJ7859244.1 hypothetical protein [Corynebacterium kalidii]
MTTCTRPRCDRKVKSGHAYCHRHLYSEGIFKPRVPVGPIRDHLQRCVEQGATLNTIARAVGVPPVTVYQAAGSYTDYRDQVGIAHDVAVKLMRATPDMAGHVPAWPYVRRVRALRAAGHDLATIADGLGISLCAVSHMSAAKYQQVTIATAEKIRAGYETMSAWPAGSITTRILAYGWAPPMLWDDIDDPDEDHEVPAGSVHVSGPVLAAVGVLDTAYGRPGTAQATGVSQALLRHFVAGSRPHTSLDTARSILRAAARVQRQAVAA